jgi:hypothetical protein
VSRVRAFLASTAIFAVTLLVCFAMPLRPKGTDTLPGRLGAVTLACMRSDDLALVEWVRRETVTHGAPYWIAITRDGRHLVSTWGPAPSWVGALAFAALPEGAVVTDTEMQRIARHAAAATLALATAVLFLGMLRSLSPRSAALWSMAVVCSVAGAGTLGQALWQQTVALPPLAAALASLAWFEKRWPLLLTPACLAVLLLTRPPEAALVLALGVLWVLRARALRLRDAAVAIVLAVAAALPQVLWSLRYFGSPLPTGQWEKNALGAAAEMPVALLGLLVSPGRGALWFAPVLVAALAVGVVAVRRRGFRVVDVLLAGVLAQLLLVSCFGMWWGGYTSFGPRLLALPLWASVAWLAENREELSRRASSWVGAALALTAIVGLAGGLLFDPAKWQHTNDARKLWQIVDSPLPALFRTPDTAFVDTFERGPFVYCERGLALGPP